MKKIILASASAALVLGAFSCSENYDVYPAEKAKVLMIKDAGTENVVIYSAQDQVAGTVTVLKGGCTPGEAATAKLAPMSQAEYDEYKENNGAAYSLLPSDCYNIENPDLSFKGGQGYEKVNYTLDVKKIGDCLENLPAGSLKPAIYLQLTSADADINKDNKMMILVPDYRELSLGFTGGQEGNAGLTSEKSGNTVTFTGSITLPIESQWEFEPQIAVDNAKLDALNIYDNDGVGVLSLMPSDAYKIVKTPKFEEGSNTAEFQIEVNAAKASPLNVLPLKLANSGMDGLELENGATLATVDFRVELTEDMLDTNAQETREGPIRNLLDGSTGTFFHTAWSFSVDDPHYLQITTPNAYTKYALMWTARSDSNNDIPVKLDMSLGEKASSFHTVNRYSWWDDHGPINNYGENGLDNNFHAGNAVMNVIAPDDTFNPFKVIRLTSYQTWGNRGKYFTMSTLTLFAL